MSNEIKTCVVCNKQPENDFNFCNECGGIVCNEHNNMCELCNYTICSNDMSTNPFHEFWCARCENEYYNGSEVHGDVK